MSGFDSVLRFGAHPYPNIRVTLTITRRINIYIYTGAHQYPLGDETMKQRPDGGSGNIGAGEVFRDMYWVYLRMWHRQRQATSPRCQWGWNL